MRVCVLMQYQGNLLPADDYFFAKLTLRILCFYTVAAYLHGAENFCCMLRGYGSIEQYPQAQNLLSVVLCVSGRQLGLKLIFKI